MKGSLKRNLRVIFLLVICITFFVASTTWKAFFMTTIEDNPYICQKLTSDEYNEILTSEESKLTSLDGIKYIPMQFNIEFPFPVPAEHIFRVQIYTRSKNFTVYKGSVDTSGIIQFNMPIVFKKYPDAYVWNFKLFVPSKLTTCVWGMEEAMYFYDSNFSRSYKIKLLTYGYEGEGGGGRSTIFEPN